MVGVQLHSSAYGNLVVPTSFVEENILSPHCMGLAPLSKIICTGRTDKTISTCDMPGERETDWGSMREALHYLALQTFLTFEQCKTTT